MPSVTQRPANASAHLVGQVNSATSCAKPANSDRIARRLVSVRMAPSATQQQDVAIVPADGMASSANIVRIKYSLSLTVACVMDIVIRFKTSNKQVAVRVSGAPTARFRVFSPAS